MEVQNRELKAQVMQTKRILMRLEEQMVKAHDTQLSQMFQMQKNNEDMHQAMQQVKQENLLLRDCLADLQQEPSTISRPQIPRAQSQLLFAKDTPSKKTVTRKTVGSSAAPTKKITLNTRKTIGPFQASSGRASEEQKSYEDDSSFGARAIKATQVVQKSRKGRTSYMTPRSSLQQTAQRERYSLGVASQSHPYEMAPSEDTAPASRSPQRDASLVRDSQPVDVYKVVKARQNLLYIQSENAKMKQGNVDQMHSKEPLLK